MRMQGLEAFLIVADELHFGRAAQRLHIAQPPLSRMIKQLEHDVGSQLFDRTTRKVRLTPAGEALLESADSVIASLDAAQRAVDTAGRGETGTVRIGYAGPSSYAYMGRLVRSVHDAHPGISLSLHHTLYAPSALRAVTEGEIDLAIIRWDSAPPEVESRVIAEERYMLALPTSHRLANRTTVSMRDCRDEPFIALAAHPGSTARNTFISAAYEAGYSPKIVQTVPDSWTAFTLVAEGLGLLFGVDSGILYPRFEGLTAVRVHECQRPTYTHLIYPRGKRPHPALTAAMEVAKAVLPTPPTTASP
jgi:DNA-binding transcriptional LysR family regulator